MSRTSCRSEYHKNNSEIGLNSQFECNNEIEDTTPDQIKKSTKFHINISMVFSLPNKSTLFYSIYSFNEVFFYIQRLVGTRFYYIDY